MCDALREAATSAARGVTFVAGGVTSFESYADLLAHAEPLLREGAPGRRAEEERAD